MQGQADVSEVDLATRYGIEKGKQYDSECQQAHRYTGILQ